jgi:hypothetical protein
VYICIYNWYLRILYYAIPITEAYQNHPIIRGKTFYLIWFTIKLTMLNQVNFILILFNTRPEVGVSRPAGQAGFNASAK